MLAVTLFTAAINKIVHIILLVKWESHLLLKTIKLLLY